MEVNYQENDNDALNKNRIDRPQTPAIDIIAIRSMGEASGGTTKNFTSLFKQIVENDNKNFLEGDINMIDYLLSKYSSLNLKEIKSLEKIHIKINSEYNLLNQFGERLIHLKELRLNGSNIKSISDLGSSYKNLSVLNMDNCNLSDLTGLVCFEKLEEFSAMNNKVSDLFEIEAVCSTLRILRLDNNRIKDEESIIFIGTLEKLETLSLIGNEVIELSNYRELIYKYIPWLKSLDFLEDSSSIQIKKLQIKQINNIRTLREGKICLGALKESQHKLSKAEVIINSLNNTQRSDEKDSSILGNSDAFSFLGRSSQITTKSNSIMPNSLRSSVTTKKVEKINPLSIDITHKPGGKLRPIKLKELEEKEDLKKIFATQKEVIDLDQEKEEIIKKLDKCYTKQD